MSRVDSTVSLMNHDLIMSDLGSRIYMKLKGAALAYILMKRKESLPHTSFLSITHLEFNRFLSETQILSLKYFFSMINSRFF